MNKVKESKPNELVINPNKLSRQLSINNEIKNFDNEIVIENEHLSINISKQSSRNLDKKKSNEIV